VTRSRAWIWLAAGALAGSVSLVALLTVGPKQRVVRVVEPCALPQPTGTRRAIGPLHSDRTYTAASVRKQERKSFVFCPSRRSVVVATVIPQTTGFVSALLVDSRTGQILVSKRRIRAATSARVTYATPTAARLTLLIFTRKAAVRYRLKIDVRGARLVDRLEVMK
jgi:hypothetical protein